MDNNEIFDDAIGVFTNFNIDWYVKEGKGRLLAKRALKFNLDAIEPFWALCYKMEDFGKLEYLYSSLRFQCHRELPISEDTVEDIVMFANKIKLPPLCIVPEGDPKRYADYVFRSIGAEIASALIYAAVIYSHYDDPRQVRECSSILIKLRNVIAEAGWDEIAALSRIEGCIDTIFGNDPISDYLKKKRVKKGE